MDNTEAIPDHRGESVETTREALLRWNKETLQADYERLLSVRALAELYGCSQKIMTKVMNAWEIKRVPMKGRKNPPWSDEWRANHKAATNTPEFKEAHRIALLNNPRTKGPSVNSPLESLLQQELLRQGISFQTQMKLCNRYFADIVILQKPIVLEADGNWHKSRQEYDAQRDADMVAAGYKVYRFNGYQINCKVEECIQLVITECDLTKDAEPVAIIRKMAVGPDNPLWRGGQPTFVCANDKCGQEFQQHRANRTFEKKFCSQKCYGQWLKDHPESNPVHHRWNKQQVKI